MNARLRSPLTWSAPSCGIVFNHEDERVVGVRAVGDLIGRQSYRVVVVGDLKFRRVHTETGGAEVAEVVMIVAQQNQIGECCCA